MKQQLPNGRNTSTLFIGITNFASNFASLSPPRGRVLPIMTSTFQAPPEKWTFLRFQVYTKAGMSQMYVQCIRKGREIGVSLLPSVCELNNLKNCYVH